jgi:hypothetical protein
VKLKRVVPKNVASPLTDGSATIACHITAPDGGSLRAIRRDRTFRVFV